MSVQITASPSVRKCVAIWATLIGSLVLLLAVSALGKGRDITLAIGTIAIANAALMLGQFMHLGAEPRFIRWMIVGAALLMAFLLFALVPDIALLGCHRLA